MVWLALEGCGRPRASNRPAAPGVNDPRAPKRRGAKFIGSGRALADVIGQSRSHVVHQHVREEIRVLEIERGIER